MLLQIACHGQSEGALKSINIPQTAKVNHETGNCIFLCVQCGYQ